MEISDSTVLITGGTGQIGCSLAEQLLKENVRKVILFDNLMSGAQKNVGEIAKSLKVELFEGDVTHLQDLKKAIKGVDYLFHLASLMTLHSYSNPRSLLEVNVNGTYNFLETSGEMGIRKIIFSSSHSVYGVPIKDLITEEHPFNHQSLYGATKVAGEQLCQAFKGMYGLDYVILRYSTVYGERQHKRGRNSTFLLSNLERIESGKPPMISGDGKRTLSLIYVGDVARANILALKSHVTSEAFLIAAEENQSEEYIIRMLLELMDSDLEPEYSPSEEPIEKHHFSVEKAERLLGFKAETSLREGLMKLIQWYRKNKSSR
jgi:UDP-glucose 4-epimerase